MVGVIIILKDSSGTEISRTTTSDEGYFEFTELDPGDYIVEEVVPDGYENTTQETDPPSVPVEDLESGQEREVAFGNCLIPPPKKGKISGYKWNDQNGNGVWDTGEPPYTERLVIILSGVAARTDLTDETGYFEFDDLEPGNYTVEETPPDDWQPTTPVAVSVTLAGGEEEQVNFGNVFIPPARAKISGHKFNDLNGNGNWDTVSEAGIGQVIITLKDSGGTILSSTETAEGTDIGYYLFENLEPGDYMVEETVPEGFQPTTASYFEVTLATGDEKKVDFGNQEIGGGPQDPICQSLTAAPTSGTVPLTVNFTTTAMDADGEIIFYEYNFGDGSDKTTLSSATTSHIYQTVGTYTASVRVQDNDGVWATSTNCQAEIDTVAPETPTHKTCQGTSCVTVEGEGEDECATDEDCIEPTHTVCSDEDTCILVSGSGTNECTDDDDCQSDRHTICQTPANICIEIEGAGTNECTTDADCQPDAPPTHTICNSDYECVSVSGAGVNECSDDDDCMTAGAPSVPVPEPTPTTTPPAAWPTAEAPEVPVPPTASTAPTWVLIFSSAALIALAFLL
jgi:PKD repeat protein